MIDSDDSVTHPYQCKTCNVKFKTQVRFEKHDCSHKTIKTVSNAVIAMQCTYCGKVFQRINAFHDHNCEKKKKYEAVTNTIQGKRSHLLFQLWMRLHTKLPNSVIEVQQYIDSKYCTTFLNFVEWSKNINLPDVEKYIRIMVKWKFPPNMWTRDDVYVKYIDFIDRTSTVDDHIRNTFNTLKKIATAAECEISEAINYLEIDQILVLVRARKLSPWVLLKTNGFKKLYAQLTSIQKTRVVATIQPAYWQEKFKNFPDQTNDIVEFVNMIGL